jgi:hypothetical protein
MATASSSDVVIDIECYSAEYMSTPDIPEVELAPVPPPQTKRPYVPQAPNPNSRTSKKRARNQERAQARAQEKIVNEERIKSEEARLNKYYTKPGVVFACVALYTLGMFAYEAYVGINNMVLADEYHGYLVSVQGTNETVPIKDFTRGAYNTVDKSGYLIGFGIFGGLITFSWVCSGSGGIVFMAEYGVRCALPVGSGTCIIGLVMTSLQSIKFSKYTSSDISAWDAIDPRFMEALREITYVLYLHLGFIGVSVLGCVFGCVLG